ncbi:hypothetical protein scyTo_0027029, partial [Scyliorhinus torazame]|nr:hypothetical protein [Scyliorhinus torazame]
WFAEDHNLFKEENPPLFAAGQKASVLFDHVKGVLLKEFSLSCYLTLE